MSLNSDKNRILENWQEEVDSAAQYRALAERESEERIKKVYLSLAQVEENHVKFWEEKLKKAGITPPPRKPSWRSRVLIFIARRMSPQLILSTIAAGETVARNKYSREPETRGTSMGAQERYHSRVMQEVLSAEQEGLEGKFLGRIEGRHRAVGQNALRAAVLGANDGLCSNLSLVMGVAGASLNPHGILVTGIAGCLAGAFSMALGEYISVASSRELAQREIRIESEELKHDPESEGEELRLIYEAKGMNPVEAQNLVTHLLKDKSRALEALSREELGINPSDLGGSPWEAAGVSFILFAAGAVIPVVPFLIFSGGNAVAASIAVSGVSLFGIGAAITIFTGRPVWKSGLRQLTFGAGAAAITFVLGRLLGAAVS